MSDVKPVVTPYMTRIHELITEYRDATTAAKKQRARKAIIECVGARDAALQAEIEALRKDAERYRMERSIRLRNLIPGNLFMAATIEEFDEAVDAAIAKEKQQECLK